MLEFHVFVVYDYYNVTVVGLYGYVITFNDTLSTYRLVHEGHTLKNMHYTITTSD